MKIPSAPLEDWLRDYYFGAEIDISSSGVQPYSMGDVRAKTGLEQCDIDALVFNDGYSLGSADVRACIAERWGSGDPQMVMTASGSSEAISAVLMALLQQGDEVIVVRPGYHLLVKFVEALGCHVKVWTLDDGADWKPQIEQLDELVTGRTRAIIVNFPHNPTGTTIGESELQTLLDHADKAGAYVLWDAAFAELTYETSPLRDISLRYDKGISFGTFSKAFGLPGLRFGWCVGPPGILADCVRLRDYTTLHVSPLVELVAYQVLKNADSFIKPRLAQAVLNRKMVREWMGSVADYVSFVLPEGGVAGFPRLNKIADTDRFCEDLYRKRGVLVVPGSCFGYPRHIRLGFGGPRDELVRGLEILSEALVDAG
jgi:capreomycidine synthase